MNVERGGLERGSKVMVVEKRRGKEKKNNN